MLSGCPFCCPAIFVAVRQILLMSGNAVLASDGFGWRPAVLF